MASLGFLARQKAALASIPAMPKLLGFGGALPFLSLTPYIVEPLFPTYVQQAAEAQVAYGALIVSFLGAVHWGMALSSTLSGPKAAAALRERYTWSVFPALAAWPALMMQTAPGSLCIAVILAICYISDRSYNRIGALPKWYMSLRGYLTTLAISSMLATTAYYLAQDVKKVQQRMQEDDARRAERDAKLLAPAPAVMVPAAAGVSAEVASPPIKKKGWW